jgi:HEAT repeat protein
VRLDLLPVNENTSSNLVGVPRNIDNKSRIGLRRLQAPSASIALINWEVAAPAVVNAGSLSPSGPYPVILSLPVKKMGQHPIVDNKFFVQSGREIPAQSTEKFRISLLFSDPGVSDESLAKEINAHIATQYPMKLDWKDRRPIGTLFLANPHTGWKTNPRGYLPGKGKDNDVTTEEGLQAFGAALMTYADTSIEILKEANAQGVIVWDLEGAEHYHPITYIAQPDKLAQIAPEMERFADDFFKKFRDAGFKTGITIRPTEVVPDPKRPGKWTHIEVKDPLQLMDDKITYAKKRWGCTIFYLDSNVFGNDWLTPEQKKELQGVDWVMPASMLADLMKKHPDILIIPEWSNWQDYLYSAPYSAVNLGQTITNPSLRAIYPDAFRVMSMSARALEQRWQSYLQGVVEGDVFLFNAWYRSGDYQLMRLLLAEADIRKQGPPNDLTKISDADLATSLTTPGENLRVQYFAIEEMGNRGKPESVSILFPFLDSPDLLLRRNAIIALGKLKNGGTPELAESLAKITRDPKSQMLASVACETLGSFGTVSHEQILSLLAESKKPERVAQGIRAALFLPESSPEISAKLIELLDSPNQTLQEAAITALGKLKVQAAVPKLIELLSHKQEVLSKLSVVALGNIGDRSAISPIFDLYKRDYKTIMIYSIRGDQNDALQLLTGEKASRTRDEWIAYFAQTKP